MGAAGSETQGVKNLTKRLHGLDGDLVSRNRRDRVGDNRLTEAKNAVAKERFYDICICERASCPQRQYAPQGHGILNAEPCPLADKWEQRTEKGTVPPEEYVSVEIEERYHQNS